VQTLLQGPAEHGLDAASIARRAMLCAWRKRRGSGSADHVAGGSAAPVSGCSHLVPAEGPLQQGRVAGGAAGLQQRCGSHWALADGARHLGLAACEHHHLLAR
jgi:hypothetical protein